MPHYNLARALLSTILKKHKLGELVSVEEIATGLINPVYLVNQNIILRIDLEKQSNQDKFKREAILYDILPKFNIPTPNLIAFDDSKETIDFSYILLSYIPGQNLLKSFDELRAEQQKEISFQLGHIVKQIHSIKPEDIGNRALFKDILSWARWTMSDFDTQWNVVSNTNFLSDSEKNEIQSLKKIYIKLSLSDKGRLTHGDLSPGNIQVYDGKIFGVFDFEFSFIADPLWDLQKLPISFQLSEDFSKKEFLKGYENATLTDEEQVRLKMYCYMQGVWEIWATTTQHMPLSEDKIQEGVELIRNTILIKH